MGAPIQMLKAMRDDAQVLALVAATDETPFTYAVIDAVANWFDDVEIKYPIAEMPFDENERRKLVHDVAGELLGNFVQAVEDATAEEELDEERFARLAAAVDPLWRELSGAFAVELNRRFEKNRIPAEHSNAYLRAMISRFEEEQGSDAAQEFLAAIRSDTRLRAHLRRIGIDPDEA
jgi:hypothetical protein